MFVIVITIITQGFWVPAESRGKFSFELLTINTGFFQAIGVISFGEFGLSLLRESRVLTTFVAFVCRTVSKSPP
jgi:hypothetical protein